MATCSFCGKPIEKGAGTMYVRNDGKILWFCSSKCRKNMLRLGRRPVDIKWTKSYEKGETK